MSNTQNSEPRVFGGRYAIESRIARGGMADVFLARDQLLDRPVALKVLFAELSVDPSFVERFRREAQNAARLSHPNIVSVYDWGEDGSTYYIVMEYVKGRSLSLQLREDGPLTPQHAAIIGSEVASALGFAHQHGVVHRDVKPGNVLIDERGSVRVTDFGIARARNTTENLTQTGAVMGTATYFSPEQAQGLPVDQRSDVYSLGVVLYELVAGKPPFQGDNPVTIAYKHVREQPTPLRDIDPTVPASYEAIVAEAMAKTPANRYASADALRADLQRFRNNMPVLATALRPPQRRVAEAAYSENIRTAHPPAPPPLPRLPKDSKGVLGPFLVFLSILAVIAIAGFLIFTSGVLENKETPKGFPLPTLNGKTRAEAEAELRRLELQFDVSQVASDTVKEDVVISQDPAPDVTVFKGNTVRLTVSEGPAQFNLANYTGQTGDAATKALQALGLTVTVVQASSDSVPLGNVIDQEPRPGSATSRGQGVKLTVSSGPEPVDVPSVVGYDQVTATQLLSGVGFRTLATGVESAQPAGVVISMAPVAGTKLAKTSEVIIYVSNGLGTTTTATTAPVTTSVIPAQ